MDEGLAKMTLNSVFHILKVGVTNNILDSLGYDLEDTDKLSDALVVEGMEMEKKSWLAVTEINKIILPLIKEKIILPLIKELEERT